MLILSKDALTKTFLCTAIILLMVERSKLLTIIHTTNKISLTLIIEVAVTLAIPTGSFSCAALGFVIVTTSTPKP
jgi:hypothetical protein